MYGCSFLSGDRGEGIFMLGRDRKSGSRFLFCRSILLMVEMMQ